MPKVSVIVPVLNGEKYILECINSLINQTLSDIEIIIVDAGSKDNTINIIENNTQNDSRVYIVNSEIKSMGFQYNLGIKLAKGDYIAFCEADDYLDIYMLERLYCTIIQAGADYVKSDFDMFIDKDERFCLRYHILNNRGLYGVTFEPFAHPEILQRDVNMWNGIYKASFAKQIMLNTTPGAAFQDSGFVIKAFLRAKKIMYISGPSYYYRRDNIGSSVYSLNTLSFVNQEFQFIFNYIDNNKGTVNKYARAIVLRRFLDMFGGFYSYLPVQSEIPFEIKENISQFVDRFVNEYNNTEYCYLEALDFLVLFNAQLLLQGKMMLFDSVRREVARSNLLKLRSFAKEIEKYQNIIFLSDSEASRNACAFLISNDVKSNIVFCETNNNTSILGKKTIPLEWAKQLEEAVYIVDNYNSYNPIFDRLLAMGIAEKDILKVVKITAHAAFELVV